MDYALAAFCILLAVIIGAPIILMRSALVEIGRAAAMHARTYTADYVRCTALIVLALIIGFSDTFKDFATNEEAMRQLTWIGWTIMFLKPIAAAITTLVAFLQVPQSSRKNPPPPNPPTKP